MKKKPLYKNRYNKLLNAFAASTISIFIINMIFIIFVFIVDSKNYAVSPDIVFAVLAVNSVTVASSLVLLTVYYRRLRIKVVQPVELVQAELQKLMSGDFETPIVTKDYDGMEEIYDTLEEVRKQLEKFSLQQKQRRELRSTYVSGLMHDIATPVTRIAGCASMISDGMVSSSADIKKFAEMIVQNTEDINIMLKNLAEIEKYDHAEIHSNILPIDMAYVIDYYVRGLKLELSADNVTISFVNLCKEKPVCRIDVKSCKRVLMNLINNSIKYKKINEPCEIIITLENREPGMLLFSLADNGIGIDGEQAEKIFELFYRADSSRHNPDTGNGIGLFVSSEIMKANNARMWAENNGNGLTVYVSFPLCDDQPVDWFDI